MKAIECPYCVHQMSPKMDVNKGFIRCPSCKDEFTWPLGGRRKSNFKKRKKPKPQSVSNKHEDRFMMQDINLTFRLSKTPTVGSVLLFLTGLFGPYLPIGFMSWWYLPWRYGRHDWDTQFLLMFLTFLFIPIAMVAFMIYGVTTKKTSLVTGTVLSAILFFGWVSYTFG